MAFERCSVGTKGPKCAKKISPTPLNHPHQPEPLRQGRMDPCFHVLYCQIPDPYHLNIAAETKTHQTRQRISNLLLSNFVEACLNCSLRFLFLADRSGHPVWSSAAVAPSASGFRCVVRSEMVFLHTLVVTSGYSSYCCLSIISNQSAHSPLTINKAFSSIITAAHWIFLFFGPFSVNPRDGCVWKSR